MSKKDYYLKNATRDSAPSDNKQTVDPGRRRTLKAGALTVSGLSLAGIAGMAQAVPCGSHASYAAEANQTTSDENENDPVKFSLQVRHSWAGNDLAVVLTNKSTNPQTITEITPARLSLPRGDFNFARLLDEGSLTLAPGGSLEIPLQPRQVQLDAVGTGYALVSAAITTGYGHFDRSVQQHLKSRVSIVTEESALASVTVVPGPVVG